ncbi:MAG: fibronectin/fibrinogen-binding protein [Symploca sp. SIO2E6]|nr:fibronectin/fibrinogen-binding protein [Symploca sp. SIO2E6]
MQTVDFTTLMAACRELRTEWIPARLTTVYQRDRYTLSLNLRTLKSRGWLTISWHPQAARICLGAPPPRLTDTFTFSDQLRHQLGGFALVGMTEIAPWERVLDLQFAQRPGEAARWHLYVEIMGKYSNVILTSADNLIVTAAHQVGAQQSSIRSIQTGQPYEPPPSLTGTLPKLSESQQRWQERVSLVPGALHRQLLKSYRGLSPTLVRSLVQAAGLDPNQSTQDLTTSDWQQLFACWQQWLQVLGMEEGRWGDAGTRRHGDAEMGRRGDKGGKEDKEDKGDDSQFPIPNSQFPIPNSQFPIPNSQFPIPKQPTTNNKQQTTNNQQPTTNNKFQPGWTDQGYTVMGWDMVKPADSVQAVLDKYYTAQLNQQEFARLHHQISQKLSNLLNKLAQKAAAFATRLQQSAQADQHRQQADLLMAYLHHWQPGMKSIELPDFETNKPVKIPLNPTQNAIQNAQSLYKLHQKLKRARYAVEPLLKAVQEEIFYLEQVKAFLKTSNIYSTPEDLQTLEEIRAELVEQNYLSAPKQPSRAPTDISKPYKYQTPNGLELLIGRNNRQNDQLTFRMAGDYDIWFHTQEIPGSHVLLRIQPGAIAEQADLQQLLI